MRSYDETDLMPQANRNRKFLGLIGNTGLFSLTETEDTQRQKKIMEFYDAYAASLYKYLRGLGLAKEESEDAIQECFLRLASHLMEGAEDLNLRSWLFQVAHNLSMDVHRKNRRDRATTEPASEVLIEPIDPNSDPEDLYLRKEAMQRANEAMTQLTPKQRHGVLLRAQGLRYMEIATVLGVSESRAIYLVKRALLRLAEGL